MLYHRISRGRIWIGTDQDGIDILDKKTGEVRQLRNKAGDERSLQNNTVMVLYEDSSETMWVGTYKKGFPILMSVLLNLVQSIWEILVALKKTKRAMCGWVSTMSVSYIGIP